MVQRLTDEKIALFDETVKQLLGVFGLGDYRIELEPMDSLTEPVCAQTLISPLAHAAVIQINRSYAATEQEILETALHEVLHIVFTGMREAADLDSRDDFHDRMFESAEHGAIERLSKTLTAGLEARNGK